MKRLILVTAVVLAAVCANAATLSPYISQKFAYGRFLIDNPTQYGGGNVIKGTNDHKWLAGSLTALGAEYASDSIHGAIRAELEFGINERSTFASDSAVDRFYAKMALTTYGFNAYYDFNAGGGFKPYIGGGFGLARIGATMTSTGVYGKDTDNNLWGQLGFGVSYAVLPCLDIDLGYRYSDYGKFKGSLSGFGTTFEARTDISSHQFLLGARYKF